MDDDAEWDEFAKLGQNRPKQPEAIKTRAEPVKPAEQRPKKKGSDSLDSWDFDAKPKTSSAKPQANVLQYQGTTVKSAGFGDFDSMLEGPKPGSNKLYVRNNLVNA